MTSRARTKSRKSVPPQPANVTLPPIRRRSPIEWTKDEARDLLRQGYEPAQVARITGYSLEWVESQSIPRNPIHPALAATQPRD